MDSKQLEELRQGKCGEAFVVFAATQGWIADIEHLVPANLTWWCFANAWLVADAAGADWQLKQIAADVAALRDTEKLTIGQAVNRLIEKWGKKCLTVPPAGGRATGA